MPLYVPVDAVFESMSSGPASATDSVIHHTLNFRVKDRCGYTFRFGHVTDPDTSLKPGDVLPAGSRVAYTIGNIPSGNWDIGFYNRLQEGDLAKIKGIATAGQAPREGTRFARTNPRQATRGIDPLLPSGVPEEKN